jgi:hypothetical protein
METLNKNMKKGGDTREYKIIYLMITHGNQAPLVGAECKYNGSLKKI